MRAARARMAQELLPVLLQPEAWWVHDELAR